MRSQRKTKQARKKLTPLGVTAFEHNGILHSAQVAIQDRIVFRRVFTASLSHFDDSICRALMEEQTRRPFKEPDID
jgi:hypothetical protein